MFTLTTPSYEDYDFLKTDNGKEFLFDDFSSAMYCAASGNTRNRCYWKDASGCTWLVSHIHL